MATTSNWKAVGNGYRKMAGDNQLIVELVPTLNGHWLVSVTSVEVDAIGLRAVPYRIEQFRDLNEAQAFAEENFK